MKPLTILVASVSSVGHVNSCAGALEKLIERGHRVIFLLEESFRGRYSPLGFEESVYQKKKNDSEEKEIQQEEKLNPGEKWARAIQAYKLIGPEPPIEKMRNMKRLQCSPMYVEEARIFNEAIKDAIAQYEPDAIYVDNNTLSPAIYYSGIPWIKNESFTPIYNQFDDDLPPGGSGLPTLGDRSEWEEINKMRQLLDRSALLNDLFESMGYDRYPDDIRCPATEILTVYAYPEELNYPTIRAKGWFNLEVFQKPTAKQELVDLDTLVPKDFLANSLNGSYSGKLIYLSMGSMGSVDLRLMKRLVEVLGKTNHKYIVSKGHLHEQYDLAENMWGDRYLPQVKILPHVDLVITHGGNNTVTETFIEGKPMIVLPLFVDQFDNAQRLEETGLGARVDAYTFTDEQLNGAVERLLKSDGLKEKLQTAAQRIRSQDRHTELAIKIEQLLRKD